MKKAQAMTTLPKDRTVFMTQNLANSWIADDLKMIEVEKRMQQVGTGALSRLLIDHFEEHEATHPRKTLLVFEDHLYTHEYVDQMACKVANVAISLGLKARDCVALMFQNEPSFVGTFLGLQKLGIRTAWINNNLRGDVLRHSVTATAPELLIVGPSKELRDAVEEIYDGVRQIRVFVQGLGSDPPPAGMQCFDHLFQIAPHVQLSPAVRGDINMDDVCCYIYTSGTTGNPKPAIVSHRRLLFNCAIPECVSLSSGDVLYMVLPLYHSAGGGTGMYSAIYRGTTMVLRRKFSASHFWSDCHSHGVTVIQYIGELFRYLLVQKPTVLESTHKIRAAWGNGLRKDIWAEVERRFGIPLLVESFGATEGTTFLINVSQKPGAIGRLSPFISMMEQDSRALVKCDLETAQPIRDEKGRCVKVGVGEPGLFLAVVPNVAVKNGMFEPYMSSKETNEKKLVRNVFRHGDLYFNYGDVFVLDKDYFLYFQDRIGDTFRWKGENVSTTEVANVLCRVHFLQDSVVYGVSIPGQDGRAGMSTVFLKDGHSLGERELKALYEHVFDKLPKYARPVLLRHKQQATVTSTFKNKKMELMQDGFDLNKIKDPLYFLDVENNTYSRITSSNLGKFLKSKL